MDHRSGVYLDGSFGVEGGVIYATPDGYKFRAAGSYDGIGDDDFDVWTAKAWLNIPLN